MCVCEPVYVVYICLCTCRGRSGHWESTCILPACSPEAGFLPEPGAHAFSTGLETCGLHSLPRWGYRHPRDSRLEHGCRIPNPIYMAMQQELSTSKPSLQVLGVIFTVEQNPLLGLVTPLLRIALRFWMVHWLGFIPLHSSTGVSLPRVFLKGSLWCPMLSEPENSFPTAESHSLHSSASRSPQGPVGWAHSVINDDLITRFWWLSPRFLRGKAAVSPITKHLRLENLNTRSFS